jgi:hypothetical protein
MNPFTYTFIKQEQCEVLGSTEIRLAWNKGFKNAQLRRILAILESQQYAIRGAWKIIFKGKIDPRLIPTDPALGFEIVDVKLTESAVEVWLSDGHIITPLSWYHSAEDPPVV